MELEMFQYIEDVLMHLDKTQDELDFANATLEDFFEEMLKGSNVGYLNINSRVKSRHSLKEKILRYDYFSKYKTSENLFANLSDLIGIRLECRFIDDETSIYKYVRKYFKTPSEVHTDFFYSEHNPNILLELKSKQPKSQKNGLKMYRIDGKYLHGEHVINFEVQIKSLVNIFWSEIEHKVIYKNYNYIIADHFYKDIMSSIKNSLTTIDRQLLLISNQFDRGNATSIHGRKLQLEKFLSKVIYDMFALKIKSSIGILVDFRKSCDTIVKYFFRDVTIGDDTDYNQAVIHVFSRLNVIESREIIFTEPIVFERECFYDDAFTRKLGYFVESIINSQFQWTLFFRILFEIEPETNAGDLENFIMFYRDRIRNGIEIDYLHGQFTEDESDKIVTELMNHFADVFIEMNTVEVLYENMIQQIIRIHNHIIANIGVNVTSFEQWEQDKALYLKLLYMRIYSAFGMDLNPTEVLELIEDVHKKDSQIDIHKSIVRYLNKL